MLTLARTADTIKFLISVMQGENAIKIEYCWYMSEQKILFLSCARRTNLVQEIIDHLSQLSLKHEARILVDSIKTVHVWSATCPISDLFGNENPHWAKYHLLNIGFS